MAKKQDIIKGTHKLVRTLESLAKPGHAKQAVRPGVQEAARGVRDKARSLVARDKGALRMSIGIKTMSTRTGVVAFVGPRMNYERDGERPWRYSHLVEFGTVTAPPQPFMRPAYNASKAQHIIQRRTKTMITKQAKKRAAKAAAS